MIPDVPDDVSEWAEAVFEAIRLHRRCVTRQSLLLMMDDDRLDILDALVVAPLMVTESEKPSPTNMAEYNSRGWRHWSDEHSRRRQPMSQTITFTIPWPGRGQARPRFARTPRGVRTYKIRADVLKESMVAVRYLEAAAGMDPAAGAVRLTVTARYLPPSSWSKKRQAEPGHKTSRPDLDNLVKLVKDGLNTIAWRDDSQVVKLDAEKVYGDRDEVVVTIERI